MVLSSRIAFGRTECLGNLAKFFVVCFVRYFGGGPCTKPGKIQNVVKCADTQLSNTSFAIM